MGLKLIIGPVAEALTVAEIKDHLSIDVSDDDTRIASLIPGARLAAEHLTGRALMLQTWEVTFDRFECDMTLPKPPLTSITSVKYLDAAGVLQTLDPALYEINDYTEPAEFRRAHGATWPATLCRENAVRIRYVAGYASAAAVRGDIKDWMKMRIGYAYANREPVVIGAPVAELPFVDRLLDGAKVYG